MWFESQTFSQVYNNAIISDKLFNLLKWFKSWYFSFFFKLGILDILHHDTHQQTIDLQAARMFPMSQASNPRFRGQMSLRTRMQPMLSLLGLQSRNNILNRRFWWDDISAPQQVSNHIWLWCCCLRLALEQPTASLADENRHQCNLFLSLTILQLLHLHFSCMLKSRYLTINWLYVRFNE